MQTFLIGENAFFLPPPLNKGLASLICASRDIIFKEPIEKFFDMKAEMQDEVLQKVRLESSPTYRLLSAMIQQGLYYPVDMHA